MPDTAQPQSLSLLSQTDDTRKVANQKLGVISKSELAQYMTPAPIAAFLASLFPKPTQAKLKLLDPGAGVGSLTSAFVDEIFKRAMPLEIAVDAYEVDPIMRAYLSENLRMCQSMGKEKGSVMNCNLFEDDFIIDGSRRIAALNSLWSTSVTKYTHCIMNPPYKKISSKSLHRRCLSSIGIETVNLYSAFVALALMLLEQEGYLVAIIPRSFCNGPYYKPFRKLLLDQTAIRRIHLFESRKAAFKEDKVLQENIVLVLQKGCRQTEVIVSSSIDQNIHDVNTEVFHFDEIVKPNDVDHFIRIPESKEADFIDNAPAVQFTPAQIGVQISTGPVVDFRLKDQLRENPGHATAPLLYPCHFKGSGIQWPIQVGKKPNAIAINETTQKWLYPMGFYTVVRRFSSKEEKRRIVASVVDPSVLDDSPSLGLENHLNVIHDHKQPLSEALAWGLAIFLNSTIVDEHFRRFSGHTQVNATDLKLMKYPSHKTLVDFGNWAINQPEINQAKIDEKVCTTLTSCTDGS